MTQRHPVQNDAIMFITTNVYYNAPIFENDAYAREAIEALYRVKNMRPFILYGFVIMPDHCHLLLRVPPPETISKIMQVFKASVPLNIGISSMWQKRFYLEIPDNHQRSTLRTLRPESPFFSGKRKGHSVCMKCARRV